MRSRQNSQYSSEISASGKATGKWISLSFTGQNFKNLKSEMNWNSLNWNNRKAAEIKHQILKNSTTFPTFIQENSPKCPVRALGGGFCKQTRHTAVLNFFNPPEREKKPGIKSLE